MAFENIHTKYRGRQKAPGATDLAALVRDGLDIDEIAALYDCSASTVKARLSQAGFSAMTGEPIVATPQADVLAELGVANIAPQGEWVLDALCAQTDNEIFFPDKGGSTREAKSVCTRCTVAAECLDYALANNERFGIWGGLSERERRRLTSITTPPAADAATA